MNEEDLALNNQQGLICHKTQPTKPISFFFIWLKAIIMECPAFLWWSSVLLAIWLVLVSFPVNLILGDCSLVSDAIKEILWWLPLTCVADNTHPPSLIAHPLLYRTIWQFVFCKTGQILWSLIAVSSVFLQLSKTGWSNRLRMNDDMRGKYTPPHTHHYHHQDLPTVWIPLSHCLTIRPYTPLHWASPLGNIKCSYRADDSKSLLASHHWCVHV